jgi:dTDP-4-dehydrorhamnose 3,5-epimerase
MGKDELINDIITTPLKQIFHPKGDIYHGMKKSDNGFSGFGEAYFSTIIEGDIKPWKKHLKMTLNLIVIEGEVKFVIYDDRSNSTTKGKFYTINLSPKNYLRLTVPPNVWMAFKGIGDGKSTLLNIANLEHDPEEMVRLELDQIPFSW